MEKYALSIVKYTNTLPLRHGIIQHAVYHEMDLQLDIPSVCAQKLVEGTVDMGLVPVAVIPLLKEYHIIGNYCIGSNGVVDTVKLYSTVPLEEIETIYLDYQSRSSIMLAQVLCRFYWEVQPQFVAAQAGFETQLKQKEAAVVIGDRCFSLNGTHPYEYDLAWEWNCFSGLPFIAAAWVSTKKIAPEFIIKMEEAMQQGIEQLDEALQKEPTHLPKELIKTYLTQRISYVFDEPKRRAMNLFLNLIQQI
ncbi:MAG: menaquinone biosynthesis protein [Bacteroidetes bacterium]|nr:menaquinone biosynthesis protein [Bacteroidota bacterium]